MSLSACFLLLEQRARKAESRRELAFVIVNESIGLCPYQKAILYAGDRIEAVSGTPTIDRSGPYILLMRRIAQFLDKTGDAPAFINAESLPSHLAGEWRDISGGQGLWLSGVRCGIGLLLIRDSPWGVEETESLQALMEAYDHAWRALGATSTWLGQRPSLSYLTAGVVMLIVIFVGCFIRVPLTVLAPAEVVAIEPLIVRAPLDGVIDKILVAPNQLVETGQSLVRMDTTTVQSRLDVTQQELTAAEAEYRQAAQLAVYDARGKAQLATLAGRVATKFAELNYLRSLFMRSTVKSSVAGLAIIDDPTALLGRAVSQGEKLMLVAQEYETEIEAWVAPADMIDGLESSQLSFFLNSEPLKSVRAQTYYVAHQATIRADGSIAYRVRARVVKGQPPPFLGMLGVARLSSAQVSLFYWIFRRPIAVVRQITGL